MKTRPYAVDKHPRCKEIQKKLAEGVPIRTLSKNYGIHRTSLERYKIHRLPEELKESNKKEKITNSQELFDIILKSVRYMEKLSESCDGFLQDPDDSEMYYMGPRGYEVDVIWEEPINGKDGVFYRKHRENLQEVIDKHFTDVVSIKTNHTDPRVLIIKSAETLTKNLEMLTQAWARMDQGESSFIGTKAWQEVVKIILDATEKHPEMRREIADALDKIAEN